MRGAAEQADAVLDNLEALSAALFTGSRRARRRLADRDEELPRRRHPRAPSRSRRRAHAGDDAPLRRSRACHRASSGAFQGGFRTAQSLSSLHCGVGSLPFNIAIARDMGHFPLRCLPDVLSDGGFDTRAFYASDLAYDSMLEFFRYHGVEGTQAADMPAGLPIGSWRGVSDRALYDQALAHASSRRIALALRVRAHAERPLAVLGAHRHAARGRRAHRRRVQEEPDRAKEDDCSRLARDRVCRFRARRVARQARAIAGRAPERRRRLRRSRDERDVLVARLRGREGPRARSLPHDRAAGASRGRRRIPSSRARSSSVSTNAPRRR